MQRVVRPRCHPPRSDKTDSGLKNRGADVAELSGRSIHLRFKVRAANCPRISVNRLQCSRFVKDSYALQESPTKLLPVAAAR